MNKLIVLLMVIIISSIITSLIDLVIGLDLAVYPTWKQLVHQVAYMLQGGVVLWALIR